MERLGRLALLLDAYGPLLTGRQAQLIRLRVEEDFSLAEIAESCGISRQAASEAIRRAETQLERYEEKLGAVRFRRGARQALGFLAAGDVPAAEKLLQDLCQEDADGV